MVELSIKKRHPLKKKDAKRYIEKISSFYNSIPDLDFKSFEIASGDDIEVILYEKEPALVFIKPDLVFPALNFILKYPPDRMWVVVDTGAIKFVSNGADVMAPGIVDADQEIKEGDVVWIREEKYARPLAVGIALMNGTEMVESKKGKAIKSVHHVGDKLWEFFKEKI